MILTSNSQLVNCKYLQQIMTLSQEQGVEELPRKILMNLIDEQDQLTLEWETLTKNSSRLSELHYRLHNLKNSYCNLGCEMAGTQISVIEQAVKEGQCTDTLSVLWVKFRKISVETLAVLKKQILIVN
ncbi:MAG: hypothetical protein K1X29_10310 [Bdellovibrionales bacterium]|nr:hypothetical protein [Bdellovibrionales bacterium]